MHGILERKEKMKTYFCLYKHSPLFKGGLGGILFILTLMLLISCGRQSNSTENRYIVLSPEIAEILAHLGIEDRIVGITAECDYPPSLRDIDVIGNFGQISLERVVALNPSIIFASALEHDEIAVQLRRLNKRVYQLYPHNTQELMEMIKLIGEICEVEDRAYSLQNSMHEQFSRFHEIALLRENKPRVFIEIYGNPIMSASNASYLGQLLLYAGAENIFPELPRDYSRVNVEEIVSLNPDVIILTYPGISANDVKNRRGWSGINAVLNNRIYSIDDVNPDLILRAGPRNIEGIERLVEILYGGTTCN
jgi:iron complex transport system substrate-binding protein